MAHSTYKEDIAAEIEADPSKASWTISDWHTWYVEVITATCPHDLTRKQLMGLLGITKAQAVITALRSSHPEVAEQLADGLDINHKDFDGMAALLVAGAVITQEDADKVTALRNVTKERYVIKKLPWPREKYLKEALN